MELFPILVSLLTLKYSCVEAELTISEIKLSWLTNTSMRIKLLENTTATILLTPTSNIPGMDTPCLFTGKLEGDPRSLVAVSGCMDSNETSLSISSMLLQGGFVDVFLVDGETYSIKDDSETSFIGIEDDVVNIPSRQKRQIPKGSDDDVVNPPPDPYPVAASFSGPLPERVTTKTDILYDNSLLGHFKGSHRETKQWISAVVELTKPHLRSLDIPITLQVGNIGHANGNIKATKRIIRSIRRLNKNRLTSLTSLFCKDTSTGISPNGLAFRGGACRKDGYALTINELHSTSNTQLRTAKVFAHELGHTFGMEHDHARLHGGKNGPCDGKGLMSYGDPPAKSSKCSNGDLKQWWRDEGYVCVKADEKNKDQTTPSPPATAGISQDSTMTGATPTPSPTPFSTTTTTPSPSKTAFLMTGGWDRRTQTTAEVYFPSTNTGCSVNNYALPTTVHTHTMNTFQKQTLICGGSPKRFCFEFSPASLDSLSTVWPKYANLTEARYEHTSWVSSAGVVLIGGYKGNAVTTAELVNGGNLPFTLPPTRDACAIGDASSDSFILTGGQFNKFKVTRYNLKGFVEDLPNMNRAQAWHACGSFESAGQMVLIVARDSTEKLVIGESRWSLASPLPRTLSIATGLNMNNKFYILGGRGSSDIDISADILEYDADQDTWKKVGGMQQARYRHAAAVIYGDFEDLCN